MAPKYSPRQRLPGPRYLIVNGDDFGFTPGITQGILSAWKNGILTSTTAMINIEGSPERVARAHADHPALPIGLHLNVTHGRPVLRSEQVRSLVDGQGRFFPLIELVARLPQISLEELRRECFAQAELMVNSGVPIDHLDCHQGMPAAYAPFFPVLIELARQYRVPVRNPVPASIYGLFHLEGSSPGRAVARAVLGFTARHPRLALSLLPSMTPAAFKRLASRLQVEGIRTTNWLVDAYFQNPQVEFLVALIEQLPPGLSEIACHPGIVDENLRRSGDGYIEPRAAELATLQDPRVKEALQRWQVKLVDFSFLSV